MTEEPLVFKFTVPVRPTVELGDYQSLRIPREPVEVPPERVQEALESLRRRYATLEPVDRPVQWNDIVRADVRGEVDGTTFVQEEDAEFQLVEGRTVSLPGFAEALIGREKGAQFEVEVTVPDDVSDERLRGKTARYHVHLKEVKQEVLPDLDDAFARQVGEGFPNVEALRSRIEDDLRRALEEEAEHRYHDQVLDALVERATIEFPPVLVEREVDRLLRDQYERLQPVQGRNRRDGGDRAALERYLQWIGKSEEEARAELRPIAEQRVKRSLVLTEVANAEHIEVTEREVEAEIDRLTSDAGAQRDELRRVLSSTEAKESLRRSLLTRRTLERLVAIASAPAEAAPDATHETKDAPASDG